MKITARDQFLAVTSRWAPQPLGLDFETNGKQLFEPGFQVVGISLAGYGHSDLPVASLEAVYVPLAHRKGTNAGADVLDAVCALIAERPVTPFYLPVEVGFAYHAWGIRLRVAQDAWVAGRLLHDPEAGLKGSVAKYLGRTPTPIEALLPAGIYDFAEADADDPRTIEYTRDDAMNAVELAAHHAVKIREAQLDAVYRLELLVATEMAIQAAIGYRFSRNVFDAELGRALQDLTRLEAEIFKDLQCRPFALGSAVQVGKALNKLGLDSPVKTPTGKPSWSVEALEQLHHPVAEKIVHWRSTFATVNQMQGKVGASVSIDGRVHPRWEPMGMFGSARFVCRDPPMPSLPEPMRLAFQAPPGQRWIKLQWRQPELRMLAYLSKSFLFAQFLHEHLDPHQEFATLFRVTREEAKRTLYDFVRSGAATGASRFAVDLSTYFVINFPETVQYLQTTAYAGANTYHVRGWLNRRFKMERETPEERAKEACRAVMTQSVATAFKVAMQKVIDLRDLFSSPQAQGTREATLFVGMGQFIPCFDTLYYCLNVDVPIAPHLRLVVETFQLNLFDRSTEGEFPMRCDVSLGPSWGQMTRVTEPALVQQLADLVADGRHGL